MPTICDTHILLFWAHEPERLSGPARQALELGRSQGELAIADITLWELALLHERGRLVLPADLSANFYLKQLLAALRLQVLPITTEIALLSRSSLGATAATAAVTCRSPTRPDRASLSPLAGWGRREHTNTQAAVSRLLRSKKWRKK